MLSIWENKSGKQDPNAKQRRIIRRDYLHCVTLWSCTLLMKAKLSVIVYGIIWVNIKNETKKQYFCVQKPLTGLGRHSN